MLILGRGDNLTSRDWSQYNFRGQTDHNFTFLDRSQFHFCGEDIILLTETGYNVTSWDRSQCYFRVQ